MKHIAILFLLSLICLNVSSQTRDEYKHRIENGQLSFQECEELIESGDAKSALPSLYNLQAKYEHNISSQFEDYLKVIFLIENYYNSIGDITSSYKILQRAKELERSINYNENTPIAREFLIKMGRNESLLKAYNDALYYYMTAQVMCNEANDKSDLYIGLLCNIAIAYQNTGDLLLADIYVEEAKELYDMKYGNIYEKKDTKDDLQVYILVTFGKQCVLMRKTKEAEKVYSLIIDIQKDYQIENEALAISHSNLSEILIFQNRFEESLYHLNQIHSHNPELDYLVYQNLTWNHLLLGNSIEATDYLKKFNTVSRENVISTFSNFSEMNRENYWNKYAMGMITLNNLVAYKTQNSDAIIQAYNNTLFCKTLLSGTSNILKKYINDKNDSILTGKYNDYRRLRESLSYKTNDRTTKDEIAYNLVKKEEEILSSLDGLNNLLENYCSSWDKVAGCLDKNEAAIEFCYIITMDSITNAMGNYGAFVVRKDSKAPQIILLGGINDIDILIQNIDDDILSINEFYSSEKSKELYNLTWKIIEPYIKDCSTVYYSTTGQLANINYDIICDTNSTPLCEKYKLIRVSSTNNISIVKGVNRPINYISSILYGGIKYTESLTEMTKESERYSDYSSSPITDEFALRSISNRGNWGEINATRDEILKIEQILNKNNVSTKILTGTYANEESFKALSGNSPDIIHLATHGYYVSSKSKASVNSFLSQITPYSEKERYMQWSGLLMAGANNAWNGKFNLENVEDGILTADEISRLDLSKTKIVVLSACETAKGYIDPVDGVYGLQQAFKKAGVGTIVMSLWKVPDDATSMLMNSFYTLLNMGSEKHDALLYAMNEVRKKYKDPYYWAGFIILD